MANSVANVAVGKPKVTGGAFRAPLGTALPTDSSVALDVAFKGLGYVGEDGVTFNPARSTDKKKAWGGDIVKVTQSEYSETWQFTLIEYRNPEVQKTVFGDDNVTVTAADATHGTRLTVAHNGDILPNQSFAFEMLEGVAANRIVLPNAQVNEVGEISYQDDELIAYQVTVEAFQDESGNNSYEYSDDGVLTP
ncbi:MAG TPA: hypothetical protein VIQ11_12985 [Mycobacterium sp.]